MAIFYLPFLCLEVALILAQGRTIDRSFAWKRCRDRWLQRPQVTIDTSRTKEARDCPRLINEANRLDETWALFYFLRLQSLCSGCHSEIYSVFPLSTITPLT